MVLLRRTTEVPPRGRVGIDLHLGQKSKLGGRYADNSLIYISYFVGPMYIHVSPSLLFLFLFPPFQNIKRPKIFPLFLFVCLFSLLPSVCFTCYLKTPKIFCFVCYFLRSCFKNRKPKNICCSSLVL
jgi:hypothetical protein